MKKKWPTMGILRTVGRVQRSLAKIISSCLNSHEKCISSNQFYSRLLPTKQSFLTHYCMEEIRRCGRNIWKKIALETVNPLSNKCSWLLWKMRHEPYSNSGALNKITMKIHSPKPHMADIMDSLQGSNSPR